MSSLQRLVYLLAPPLLALAVAYLVGVPAGLVSFVVLVVVAILVVRAFPL